MPTITLTLHLPNGELLPCALESRPVHPSRHPNECVALYEHRKEINALVCEKLGLSPKKTYVHVYQDLEEEREKLRKWYKEFFPPLWPELTLEQHAENLQRILYDRTYGWYAYGRDCVGTCYETDTTAWVDVFPKVKRENLTGTEEDNFVSEDEE